MNSKFLILFTLVVIFSSCKSRNKINTEEQKLAVQILQEEEKQLKQIEPTIPDSIPQGFHFKEDRSVQPDYQPKIIDISTLFNTEKNYKLSELISDIEYIPLEDIPVDDAYRTTGFEAFLAEKHLIIKSMFNLYLFNRDGSFRDVICNGNFDQTKNGSNFNVSVASTSSGAKGVWGDVWTIGNQLYYRYADNIAKKNYLMRYDLDSPQISLPMAEDVEKYQMTGKGEVQASLAIDREKRYTQYIPLNNVAYVGINRKTKSARNGLLMTAFRMNGDTLSAFPDYETISNYSHSFMRGNFPQITYRYGKVLTFRNAFNDTVYRVVPPNRFIPAYILKMGDFKIETQEGFTPGQDISDKLYFKEFFETEKYIYLKLFQGYDSPNNRKDKRIKIYYAIYEKETGRLNRLPINPLGYYGIKDGRQNYNIPRGVINDFDGGFIFWPQKVNANGEAYEVVTGDKLKEHISSERFINSLAPERRKENLRKLSEKVRDDQLILIVYITY